VIKELARRLAARPAKHITNPERIIAAVLIPCFIKNGEYHILFIQRTDKVRDHKSQISFPGGALETTDASLQACALRETEEEIGVKRDAVKVIGRLDDMATAGTRYIISPFVGVIPYPYSFKVDEFETEEIIEVPLSALLAEGCMEEGTALVDGKPIESYFYRYGKWVIWGATARILNQFLGILCELRAEGASLEAD
jgi:8-oxo-dGTP pyrophosphatase MutT (NUDIX family)